jgi:hypothetical protein
VRLSRAYLPGMKQRNWGRIVFISSESAINTPAESPLKCGDLELRAYPRERCFYHNPYRPPIPHERTALTSVTDGACARSAPEANHGQRDARPPANVSINPRVTTERTLMSQPEQFEVLILGSGQGGKLLTWGHRRICSKSYAKRHRGRRSADFAGASVDSFQARSRPHTGPAPH